MLLRWFHICALELRLERLVAARLVRFVAAPMASHIGGPIMYDKPCDSVTKKTKGPYPRFEDFVQLSYMTMPNDTQPI